MTLPLSYVELRNKIETSSEENLPALLPTDKAALALFLKTFSEDKDFFNEEKHFKERQSLTLRLVRALPLDAEDETFDFWVAINNIFNRDLSREFVKKASEITFIHKKFLKDRFINIICEKENVSSEKVKLTCLDNLYEEQVYEAAEQFLDSSFIGHLSQQGRDLLFIVARSTAPNFHLIKVLEMYKEKNDLNQMLQERGLKIFSHNCEKIDSERMNNALSILKKFDVNIPAIICKNPTDLKLCKDISTVKLIFNELNLEQKNYLKNNGVKTNLSINFSSETSESLDELFNS